jgi:ABC-2 type transport system ATP-binding protein
VHEITITFAEAVAPEPFARLSGVTSVETTAGGLGLRIAMQGSADLVIKAAAQHRVVSLVSHEPSLEEIFLRYYEGDSKATRVV